VSLDAALWACGGYGSQGEPPHSPLPVSRFTRRGCFEDGHRSVDFGWSPDGSRMVFSRIDEPCDTSPASLYLVKVLGTSRLSLLTDNRQVN
jgi:hypothetical protein